MLLEVRAGNAGGARVLRRPRVRGGGPAAALLPGRRDRGGDGLAARARVRGRIVTMAHEPLVLGIETSCDETGVGIVRGHTLLADAVASSVDEHARFGGVVPEVASRAHLEAMVPTIERACETAGVALYDVDAIAVTSGPGPGRRPARRRRRRQGARDRPRQAAVRRQPPRRARRRRPARARPAAGAGVALLVSGGHSSAAAGRRRHHGGDAARRDHRRRGGGGVRQGRPAARAAVPRRPAHRPRGPLGQHGRHRLPARADLAARPGAAPLRLLVLRAQDRGRALGRGAASAPASRCRSPTSPRRSRRRCATCWSARRSTPPPEGIEDLLIGGGVAANSRLRALAEERAAEHGIRVRVPRPGLAPTTARWSPRSAPSWSPAAATPSALDLPADSSRCRSTSVLARSARPEPPGFDEPRGADNQEERMQQVKAVVVTREGRAGRGGHDQRARPRAGRGAGAGAGLRRLPHRPALPRGRDQRRLPVPARPRGRRVVESVGAGRHRRRARATSCPQLARGVRRLPGLRPRRAVVLLRDPQRHPEDDARRGTGTELSPALGIGAFAEKTLVAAGQCTKVDP